MLLMPRSLFIEIFVDIITVIQSPESTGNVTIRIISVEMIALALMNVRQRVERIDSINH